MRTDSTAGSPAVLGPNGLVIEGSLPLSGSIGHIGGLGQCSFGCFAIRVRRLLVVLACRYAVGGAVTAVGVGDETLRDCDVSVVYRSGRSRSNCCIS